MEWKRRANVPMRNNCSAPTERLGTNKRSFIESCFLRRGALHTSFAPLHFACRLPSPTLLCEPSSDYKCGQLGNLGALQYLRAKGTLEGNSSSLFWPVLCPLGVPHPSILGHMLSRFLFVPCPSQLSYCHFFFLHRGEYEQAMKIHFEGRPFPFVEATSVSVASFVVTGWQIYAVEPLTSWQTPRQRLGNELGI